MKALPAPARTTQLNRVPELKGPEKTACKSQISQNMANLSDTIASLHEVITMLEDRLEPMMRDQEEQPTGLEAPCPNKLSQQLDRRNMEVAFQRSRLQSILERLEV